jgi:hypothetical protein
MKTNDALTNSNTGSRSTSHFRRTRRSFMTLLHDNWVTAMYKSWGAFIGDEADKEFSVIPVRID